ncbi:MAG: zf-HC2 domain-containing protein [Desulfitobacteriaceae bacterium]|nr:zf-HC2 domain-containing protein [Desulfitobacteriaceae bacterium]MDD4346818.1 zf-HC2 domain-containing protein [Desulfitobacteriaceae bacterium]
MGKISCNIVKDLLPLYVDGALSEETAKAVQAHIEMCESCREDYRVLAKNLTLPSNQNIQAENSKLLKDFKHKWKIKKISIACISVMLTAIVIISCYMVYQHVGKVHDFFSPSTMISLRGIQSSDGWERINFEESNYLIFDSVFYSKEVVNDANSGNVIELRISDKDGNIIIDDLVVQPGEGASLDALQRNTEYIVEVKADADIILIRFY